MELNNDLAKQKWDKIVNSEKTTLEKIASGKGTPDDYKRLADIIRQYSNVASDLFKRGLEIISREAHSKAESTAAEKPEDLEAAKAQAVQQVFADKVPDLLDTVKELVEDAPTPEDHADSYIAPEFKSPSLSNRNDSSRQPGQTYDDSSDGRTPTDSTEGADPNSSTTASDAPLIPVSIDDISADAASKLDGMTEDRRNWVKDWWRNFKGFVARNTTRSGILAELAKLSAMALTFSPQLRDWVSQKIDEAQNYLSDTYLGKVALDAWDYVKNNYEKFTTLEYWEDLMQGVWNTVKEEGKAVLESILKTFEELKDWGAKKWDQVSTATTDWTANKLDDTQAWWAQRNSDSKAEDITKLTKRIQEMKDYKGKLNKPETDREHQNLNVIIARKEKELEEAKQQKAEYDRELAEIKQRKQERDAKNPDAATSASGGSASAPSTSASTGGASGSWGAPTNVAATPPSTQATQPGVKIEASAKPPEPKVDPSSSGGGTDGNTNTSGSPGSTSPNIDSFGFAPNVDDRLLLANMLE